MPRCQHFRRSLDQADLPRAAQWSVSALREVLATNAIAEISRETLRKILKVSWQSVKTWKAGTDPKFAAKMNRNLDLYDHPPADGRVICVDEFGPLNLPTPPGRGWFPQRRPKRLRATYHRTHGVRHLLGALDLASGNIHDRIRDRKRWTEFLAFLKTLRARWPGEKLYVIAGNFSPHKRAEVREWSTDNHVELVFLPSRDHKSGFGDAVEPFPPSAPFRGWSVPLSARALRAG